MSACCTRTVRAEKVVNPPWLYHTQQSVVDTVSGWYLSVGLPTPTPRELGLCSGAVRKFGFVSHTSSNREKAWRIYNLHKPPPLSVEHHVKLFIKMWTPHQSTIRAPSEHYCPTSARW